MPAPLSVGQVVRAQVEKLPPCHSGAVRKHHALSGGQTSWPTLQAHASGSRMAAKGKCKMRKGLPHLCCPALDMHRQLFFDCAGQAIFVQTMHSHKSSQGMCNYRQ